MLTPEYYLQCTDALVDLMTAYDESVIADIARRLVKAGEITDTARMQVEALQQSGLLYDDVMQRIAEMTGASNSTVRAIFEDAGVASVDYDNAIYAAAGMQTTGIKASPQLMQVLQAGYTNTLGKLNNLTLTTANAAQQSLVSSLDLAMIQIQSGAMGYQDAIRRAIQTIAQEGTYVIYPSGHRDRVEVAARRAIMTGVGQTCRTIGEQNASLMGNDLMELSAHAGARPSHAQWQGGLVSLSGQRGYLSKSDIGYGEVDGFGGANCRHDWYPYIKGISERNYTAKDLQAIDSKTVSYNGNVLSYYDATQLQRKMEREIRDTKCRMVASQAARDAATNNKLITDLDTDFAVYSKALSAKRDVLRDFLEQTSLLYDSSRTQLYGYGRSISGKSTQTARKIREYNQLIGTMTSLGIRVTGISDHFGTRAVARGISVSDILDALTNTLHYGRLKEDLERGNTQELIGLLATPMINLQTGILTTVIKTSSKIAAKYR